MPTVLITGASRGIGLEFVRQYLADGWRVLACCRTPSAADKLADLAASSAGKVTVHALDVDDAASATALSQEIGDTAIDVLINNAGITGHRDNGIGTMDYAAWEGALKTNVMGPMKVTEALIGNLLAGAQKKLITISSRMGSIGENAAANAITYRSSKAAVNMVMSCLANGLADKGVTAVCFHPGWVRTDMGGPSAAVAPEDSVAGMRQVIASLSTADNGSFRNFDGGSIAW